MLKRIGLGLLSLGVAFLMLWGFQIKASADNIDSHVTGLDAPSKIEEETGNNTYTEVTDKTAPLKSGQNYRLTYSWTVTDGSKVSDGDTTTVTLPESASHGMVTFPVTTSDQNHTVVGQFKLDSDSGHTATIQFNDALANANVYHQGSLSFNVTGTADDTSSDNDDYVVAKNGWIQDSDFNAAGIPTQAVWQIVLNPAANNMGTVTLTDTLGAYQSYADGFKATDDATGEILKPTVSVDGSKLTITFAKVTSKITLSYYTKVDVDHFSGTTSGFLSNSVNLVAENGETGSAGTDPGSGTNPDNPTITGDSHKNVQWGGSAEIDGTYIGNVKLTKSASDGTRLNGAEYKLQKLNESTKMFEDYQTKLTTESTSEGEGVLNDYGLPVGTYQFIETKAPSGYQINLTPVAFTISPTDASAQQSVQQVDTKGSVKLTKVDKQSQEKLQGAQYQLAYDSGWDDHKANSLVTTESYTTGTDGTLTVMGLAPGDYEFVEEQAPTSYQLNRTPIPFTIDETQQAENTVSVEQEDEPNNESTSSSENSDSLTSSNSIVESGSSSKISDSSNPSVSSNSLSYSSESSQSAVSSVDSSHNVYSVTSSSSESSTDNKESQADKTSFSSSSNGSSDDLNTAGNQNTPTHQDSGSSRHHHSLADQVLPKTNEAKTIYGAIGGLLLLGSGLSLWQYRRTRKN
ncbi:MSCRAMM family protein [Levilactobacillus yiduensis]|uniref:MSCRAMM family protein n=1 Tax=Levilactobacillus yiduensis TaxID=2953880 RepID=UPI000EF2F913|nr:SpaA isopeptide-forming pilin-related protein [Levilactobacillus yiduensis]AYM03380.1 LPXTG cell wall anchor domain-containing protein [Levilactobacillus brevis]